MAEKKVSAAATKVDSKHAKGKAFPPKVCDAIRHHVGEIQALEAERSDAFDRRNGAIETKRGLKDPESKEYLKACRDHSDAMSDIDRLDAEIKFHRAQISRCVKQADDPQLELKLERPDPEAEQLPLNPEDTPKKRRAKDEGVDLSKPVGKVPEKTGKTDDPLDRPLGDLDLRQNLRSKIVNSSWKTVRELARSMDNGKGIDFEEVWNMTQDDVLAVKRAVQKMRDEAAAKK